tara:strand:- start:74 stop:727 length:654 start_codon:yes stop_codon:yes gene_type:complete
MSFKPIKFLKYSKAVSIERSKRLYELMKTRRSIREFSRKKVPDEVIINAIKTASSAPSGANKQPWHFVVVKDSKIKKDIRLAAEKEEKLFYSHRAPESWLKDLNQFGTDWNKPFLEKAPALIVVFRQSFSKEEGVKKKNYYVNESVGIASGFLLTALHNAGLATLTHTPSPMGFLEKILGRPNNEKATLLIPIGYPTKKAVVPDLIKKPFNEIATVL